jgi:beta-glucosidase
MQNVSASLRANHHLLLGQGLAVQAFRASGAKGEIGNQHGMKPARPASASEEDVAAARRVQAYFNLLATDPQLRGEYPALLMEWYGEAWPHEAVFDGDLDTISTPIDFFGMDYYNDFIVRHDPTNATTEPYGANILLEAETVRVPASQAGMYDALLWVRDRYGNIPIHLVEIGIPLEDTIDNGKVHDPVRIAYFRDLLTGAHRAIGEGVDLRSCFIWSFLDGWEFNAGLSSRYGLVHVDYETGQRTVKDSGQWYRDVIAAQGIAVV